MEWKRNLHEKHQTRLIETYHYELTEGILQQSLEQKLKDLGVKFNRRTDEKVLEELRKFGAVSALAEFLAKLLKACKRDGICPAELQPENFPGVDPNQLQQTRTILSLIYELYQNHFKENQEIDFDDMIHKAINYVESGRFAPPWRYILVDEFQDISEPQAKLVKTLKNPPASAPCFAWATIGNPFIALQVAIFGSPRNSRRNSDTSKSPNLIKLFGSTIASATSPLGSSLKTRRRFKSP